MIEPSPVSAGITVSSLGSCNLTQVISRHQLRTVNHRLTCQCHMLQNRNGTTSLREIIVILLQCFCIIRRVLDGIAILIQFILFFHPAADIETNTILAGISTQISTQTVALDIIETILHGVLLAADEMFLIGRKQTVHLGITLHVCHWHHIGRIACLSKTHAKIATILMSKLHEMREELQSLQERWRMNGSVLALTILIKSPELLGIVPSQKVRIVLVVALIKFQVIVIKSAASAAGRLDHGPDTVLCTYLHP